MIEVGRKVAAPGPLAIEAAGLRRRFGSVQALGDVSLSIVRGEFFSLLGPSGCGKTTLLRIIAGLDHADSGWLKIGGQDAAFIPAHRRPVNTVFQSYALFPHLRVRENVGFGLRMRGVPRTEAAGRVDRVLSLVKIEHLAQGWPAQLSGGEKQRVALARALVNEPEVLLLDEPLGALDLKLRKELQVELHRLQRRLGITFIYVTHDQDEALMMSDRIAVMNAGRIEQTDAAGLIYERPRTRFVAQFLGSCNLLSGKVDAVAGLDTWVSTPLGRLRVDCRRDTPAGNGTAITLAIRPEKVRLRPRDSNKGENCVAARLEEMIYSGAETQYRLSANGQLLTAVALNAHAGNQSLKPGDWITCELPPAALVEVED